MQSLLVFVIMTLFHVFFYDQDFYYPENVAYPVGGPGGQEFVVLEMHYDNPQLVSGMCIVTDMVTTMFPHIYVRAACHTYSTLKPCT